jgi:hypothetical protein
LRELRSEISDHLSNKEHSNEHASKAFFTCNYRFGRHNGDNPGCFGEPRSNRANKNNAGR